MNWIKRPRNKSTPHSRRATMFGSLAACLNGTIGEQTVNAGVIQDVFALLFPRPASVQPQGGQRP